MTHVYYLLNMTIVHGKVRLPMGIIILNMDYLEKGFSMDKPKILLVDVLEGTLSCKRLEENPSKPSKPE